MPPIWQWVHPGLPNGFKWNFPPYICVESELERCASLSPNKPFPADIGKNPSLQGFFVFSERTKVTPILLWLVVALYLLQVI